MDAPSRAAVLFADVSGSTRLYELAGDRVAAAAIEQCLGRLRQATGAAGGRVVKTIGDEVMAVFPTADAAARAAMAMQDAVSGLEPAAGIRLGIRIGFNVGSVVERDGDVFGDAVNVAARLVAQARKDDIVTSRETRDELSADLQAACRHLYSVQVKGKEQEVELCQLIWQPSDDVTTLVRAPEREPRSASLRLVYRGQEVVLDASRSALTLGRDRAAGLVIEDSKASRAHCKIERRMDKFVLADHSANGTYITVQGDAELVLRREELTLRGSGWIAFGQSRAGTTETVEFFCQG